MIKILISITVFSLLPVLMLAQSGEDKAGINYRYTQAYYFITMEDTIFTFESEFVLPEGYRHADSSELSPFQNYVANFPLWHKDLPIGNFKGGIEFEKTEISRPVHLPHQGLAFTDRAIPIRILAEYLHDNSRELELEILPINGDTLKFSKWMHNEVFYGPRKFVKYREIEPRDSTLNEYYSYMKTCMRNTNYQSLTYNCDPVDIDDVLPGDIFVARNENGRKGKVYVVIHMLVNGQKDKLYAVATGCEKACDFYIPLFNNDRNNPWLTVSQISELKTNYPISGFFRLQIR
jgi:hypothetical protein